MRFDRKPVAFGRTISEDEPDRDDVPNPLLLKLATRRAACVAEASQVLARLPGPGESLHALCTARLDLADVLHFTLERLGRCERLIIATLGYNERNLLAMTGWLDSGAVGSLTLLASIFFRSHKRRLWEDTLSEFRQRNQRAACCHSHAKVVALAFASGARLCIEGSANLCGNGSGREQFALVNDPALHDWHAAWINELVSKHEGKESQGD